MLLIINYFFKKWFLNSLKSFLNLLRINFSFLWWNKFKLLLIWIKYLNSFLIKSNQMIAFLYNLFFSILLNFINMSRMSQNTIWAEDLLALFASELNWFLIMFAAFKKLCICLSRLNSHLFKHALSEIICLLINII